mgnify:CR=1 FL=1
MVVVPSNKTSKAFERDSSVPIKSPLLLKPPLPITKAVFSKEKLSGLGLHQFYCMFQ